MNSCNVVFSRQAAEKLDGQYDIIAKLWMEQVDAKAIKKCSTMFLSVLPPGRFTFCIIRNCAASQKSKPLLFFQQLREILVDFNQEKS